MTKKLRTFALKLALVAILVFASGIGLTASYYSDIETSQSNNFTATSLDMEFTSPELNFIGPTLTPTATATRSATLTNVGDLPFEYDQQYSFNSGDADLCNALDLQVTLNSSTLIYSGPLTSFSYIHPTPLASSDQFDYITTLPPGASSTLRNKTCDFDLIAESWQVGGAYGSGFYDQEILNNSVGSGNWPPPAPALVSPADGILAGINSPWTASPVMDWSDVPWNDPLTYIYQSSLANTTNPDGSFTTPIFTSGTLAASQIPAPGTPNGTYFWHTRACDLIWGCGDWSSVWSLTVDNTIQQANSGDVIINEIMWMGSSTSDVDEWLELRNTTASPIILKNWVIENAGDSSTPNLVIPGGTIPAGGFFLIANFDATPSALLNTISIDLVTTAISLNNSGEQLTLKDAIGNTIDQTPAGAWAAGVNEGGSGLNQSMERNDDPDTGWHTCLDTACNDTTYWDSESDDYGTPKAANLSENDPSSPVVISPMLQSLYEVLETPASTESAQTIIIPDATPASPSAQLEAGNQ